MIPLRDANPTRQTPIVTIGLIVACALVFVFELSRLVSGGDRALAPVVVEWGIVPVELVAALRSGAWLSQETATLVTSQFLHGGWWHLISNMLFLWVFADNIEDAFGHAAFAAFYLTCGVVAGLAHVLTMPASAAPLVGASGAVSGVLGAYLVLFPKARVWILLLLRLPLRTQT